MSLPLQIEKPTEIRAFIIKIIVLFSKRCLILLIRCRLYRPLEESVEYVVVKGYGRVHAELQVFYNRRGFNIVPQ